MIFYFMIPFLFNKIRSLQSTIVWFIGTVLLSFIVNWVAGYIIQNYTSLDFEHEKIWYLYFWLPNQLPVFMLGIVLFHLLKKKFQVSQLAAYAMIVFAVAAMIGLFYAIPAYNLGEIIPEHLVVAVLFVVIVFAMSQAPILLLENRLTRYLGKLSFSMYVWHFVVLDSIAFVLRRIFNFEWNVQLWILYVLAIAGTAIVSAVSYNLIELAGVRIGKKVIGKITHNNTIKASAVDVVN